jgi:hypothetical protein
MTEIDEKWNAVYRLFVTMRRLGLVNPARDTVNSAVDFLRPYCDANAGFKNTKWSGTRL